MWNNDEELSILFLDDKALMIAVRHSPHPFRSIFSGIWYHNLLTAVAFLFQRDGLCSHLVDRVQ